MMDAVVRVCVDWIELTWVRFRLCLVGSVLVSVECDIDLSGEVVNHGHKAACYRLGNWTDKTCCSGICSCFVVNRAIVSEENLDLFIHM